MPTQALTPVEADKPYAKYFHLPTASPDPGQLGLMAKAMDPRHALPPERMNDLLDPGYHEVESGWCVMPNGSGYVANHTPMPGVTLEMINWWFAWHALEDLRYKLWFPEGHFAASIPDPAERARVLDPATPMTARFQGITHHVVEDVGLGAENIRISFLTPEAFGFDMTRFKAPAVGTLVAANGKSRPVGAWRIRPWAPAMMCHFIRATEDGIEFRSRFWMGYQVVDRKPKCKLPPFLKLPEKIPQALATHNVLEYTNLAAILPKIYHEQKGEF